MVDNCKDLGLLKQDESAINLVKCSKYSVVITESVLRWQQFNYIHGFTGE